MSRPRVRLTLQADGAGIGVRGPVSSWGWGQAPFWASAGLCPGLCRGWGSRLQRGWWGDVGKGPFGPR